MKILKWIISIKTFTGFNLSTLFDLKTLHFEESTDNFVKFYSLMKDELFDPIDCVTLENIKPYDVRLINTSFINNGIVDHAI